MTIKKVMFTDKKGAWQCPDGGQEWEFDLRQNPNPALPLHTCKKRGEPTFHPDDVQF